MSNVSPESLIAELQKGRRGGVEINMHVWLTLPDMSILDFTICSDQDLSRGIVNEIEDSVMYLKPDDNDINHYYDPMIVGSEYLQQTGIYSIK